MMENMNIIPFCSLELFTDVIYWSIPQPNLKRFETIGLIDSIRPNISKDIIIDSLRPNISKDIKKIKCKHKVTFAPKPIIIFIEIEDRKGPWETYALDRYRFNCRIKDVESKIGWCLGSDHRKNILIKNNF
ncbi:MyD116-like domain protein [Invertebrate iridescent virus 22]|uniref:MyD116-like domain protein n=1 Tax=Invertebrate iridescent virus 22 TaxID=345198 RepID=S6DF93_9VIRU|nr:MyD116-like domain protein [Invertebrate iridescent virus 22]CCV01830.1 MyD116-like domain protein [Invertebrate iridescent virus 22]